MSSQVFRLNRLFNRHQQPITIEKETEGHYDPANNWIPGETILIETKGIVTSLSGQQLLYGEGFSYSVDDRNLYIFEDLELSTDLLINNVRYTIMKGKKDYTKRQEGLYWYIISKSDRQPK